MIKEFATAKVKPIRDRIGPKADGFLIFLSVVSVSLVIINEFLPNQQFMVPGMDMGWTELQQLMRTFTWFSFVTVWWAMGLTSHRPLFYSKDPEKQSYLRKWWLEAVICVCWIPFSGGVLIHQLHSLFSLQALLLFGSAAHVARVSRFTAQKFNAHPLVTVGAAMASLVTFGTVMLMVVEPETFTNFHEAALSVYMNGLTIGGDLKATKLIAKDLQALISTAEIGLLAVFFAVVREWVQYGIFKHEDTSRVLAERLDAQSAELKELRTLLTAFMVHSGMAVQATAAQLEDPSPPVDGQGDPK